MQIPPEIAFRNVSKPDWAEGAIRDHMARLEDIYDRLTTCRVRVESGASSLSPRNETEQKTLRRVEAGENDRLACQARVLGSGVSVTKITWPLGSMAPGASSAALPPGTTGPAVHVLVEGV